VIDDSYRLREGGQLTLLAKAHSYIHFIIHTEGRRSETVLGDSTVMVGVTVTPFVCPKSASKSNLSLSFPDFPSRFPNFPTHHAFGSHHKFPAFPAPLSARSASPSSTQLTRTPEPHLATPITPSPLESHIPTHLPHNVTQFPHRCIPQNGIPSSIGSGGGLILPTKKGIC
jgi:hypothetical protein